MNSATALIDNPKESKESLKTISDLREAMFGVIEGLKNKTLETQRAREISNATQVIINSIKVEMEYRRSIKANARIALLEKV